MAEPAGIDIWYASGDRFLIQVRDHHIVVDQPHEAGGEDLGPTPVELFVASLAACVGFFAERYLRNHELDVNGLKIEARFEMSRDRPARVGSIEVRLTLPDGFPAERAEALQAVMRRCTVHNSLMAPPEVRIRLEERVDSVV